MTSAGEHKFTQQNYMDERIEIHENANQHAHENTSLLKVREDLLNASQVRMNTQNKVFWLQTFGMFIFIYASTCFKFNTGVDLAFFVGIFMAIPIIAKQTGANLNPAVSFSMIAKNEPSITYTLMWIYFKAQVIGAIISMIFAMVLNDVYRQPLYPSSYTQGQIIRMILSQAVGVFALIFFVLYATGPYSFIENNGAKFFYISLFVYIGRKFAVASGNQINLALSISQAFVGIPICNFQGFKYIWIWIMGDALGVIIAAKFYNGLLEPTVAFLKRKQRVRQQYKKAHESEIELKNMGNKA